MGIIYVTQAADSEGGLADRRWGWRINVSELQGILKPCHVGDADLFGRGIAHQDLRPIVGAGLGTNEAGAEKIAALVVAVAPSAKLRIVREQAAALWKRIQMVGSQRIGSGGNGDTGHIRGGEHGLAQEPAISRLVVQGENVAAI